MLLARRPMTSWASCTLHPVITGSGGLTLANHLEVPFVQEVIAVSYLPAENGSSD